MLGERGVELSQRNDYRGEFHGHRRGGVRFRYGEGNIG